MRVMERAVPPTPAHRSLFQVWELQRSMVTQELTPGKACQKGERVGYIELSECCYLRESSSEARSLSPHLPHPYFYS